MMTSRKVLDYVAAEPFRPFRLHMASGKSFDIRHPEMILLGKSSVRVHAAQDDDQEQWRDISLMLMESIEPIEAAIPR